MLSHQRAAAAIRDGKFKDEIVPVQVTVQDKDGNPVQKIFDTDEGVRADTTLAGLNKLKAAFKEGGSTTAGNASKYLFIRFFFFL